MSFLMGNIWSNKTYWFSKSLFSKALNQHFEKAPDVGDYGDVLWLAGKSMQSNHQSAHVFADRRII